MRFQPRRAEEPDLNMTSLIDVVLLLLIFFMLSTRFIDEGRLQLRLPEAGVEPGAVQRDAVEIDVTAEGGYRVNGRALINNSRETLTAAIGKAAGNNRAIPVTVRADARATHQSVVTALDVAGQAGYRQINIATVHDGQ
ncbi:MAG: biopolymer transporter ExbD [Steroidobacteraceae bacterium]|nr:biopolymer transporter ExbD [Steroidobacteraceae bacterium]